MTPAARMQAAVEVLDAFQAGEPAERALTNWARAHRFAGSGDRAAIRDLVYHALRRLRSLSVRGGGVDGRSLMLGWCLEQGVDTAQIFGADRHAPAALTEDERAQISAAPQPTGADALDMPDWLCPALADSLGDDLPALAAALRNRAPLFLRVNALRGDVAGALAALAEDRIAADVMQKVSGALKVTENERKLASSRAYVEGWVEIQDLSSQAAVMALPDPAGLRVLDYCAGGGGKALALAARGACVTAHDISAARLAPLAARADRAGADVATVAPGRVSGRFDLVVVDAPCSGAGTWRRTPEAKWRLTPDRLADLCRLQAEVLDQAARHVAPGGSLAYITCSLLRAENDDQVAAFAQRHGWQVATIRRFSPLEAGGDGFFLSILTPDAVQ